VSERRDGMLSVPEHAASEASDALRTPDGEYKSSSGVENGLQPVQQLTGDAASTKQQ